MKSPGITKSEVTEANRLFYDAVADQYEAVDGRRSYELTAWLRRRLLALRQAAPGGRLLDLGAGSGFVSRCASGVFTKRVGVDISPRILDANRDAFDETRAADLEHLPFADGSFDVVVCFAVLHHLFSFDGLVSEAHRVLSPGGVFYSDHDMDSAFFRRFRLPLKVYRRIRNDQLRYERVAAGIGGEVYRLSEWHEEGVDSDRVEALFRSFGCAVQRNYHWYGLNGLTNRLFGPRLYRRGWAPLLSLEARKAPAADMARA